MVKFLSIFFILLFGRLFGQSIPHLQQVNNTYQLFVHNKPYTILGGELGNSTATSVESMRDVWQKLVDLNVNTVLMPVYWELIEPKEGSFQFDLYRDLILLARKYNLKIIPLWFGVWKNSMSSHVPSWVKLDQKRFPRVQDDLGRSQDILSCFSSEVLNADIKAYISFLKFIKDIDALDHTIIMMQVENEIGMLPSARDHHMTATSKFNENVPSALIEYLQKNKELIVPEFKSRWATQGYKTKGTWQEVFGKGVHTDEIFMAYYYAVFANALAKAGKDVYGLPAFVNAALNRPGREPGAYPSGGPLPHLIDLWKAAGNSIDFLAPDFYNPDFKHWCDLYTRQGDLLFVPEHVYDQTAAFKAVYAIGHYGALGFSPFHIEKNHNAKEDNLSKAYSMIANIDSIISMYRPKSRVDAVLATKALSETILRLGDYELSCKHDYTLSWNPGAKTDEWPMASAIIIQSADDEFYFGGSGIVVTFKHASNKNLNVGLLKVDEGFFLKNKWHTVRHLNGDQTHQGRHINVPNGDFTIQRVKLYTYE